MYSVYVYGPIICNKIKVDYAFQIALVQLISCLKIPGLIKKTVFLLKITISRIELFSSMYRLKFKLVFFLSVHGIFFAAFVGLFKMVEMRKSAMIGCSISLKVPVSMTVDLNVIEVPLCSS